MSVGCYADVLMSRKFWFVTYQVPETTVAIIESGATWFGGSAYGANEPRQACPTLTGHPSDTCVFISKVQMSPSSMSALASKAMNPTDGRSADTFHVRKGCLLPMFQAHESTIKKFHDW